jgi:hypothetical protein
MAAQRCRHKLESKQHSHHTFVQGAPPQLAHKKFALSVQEPSPKPLVAYNATQSSFPLMLFGSPDPHSRYVEGSPSAQTHVPSSLISFRPTHITSEGNLLVIAFSSALSNIVAKLPPCAEQFCFACSQVKLPLKYLNTLSGRVGDVSSCKSAHHKWLANLCTYVHIKHTYMHTYTYVYKQIHERA